MNFRPATADLDLEGMAAAASKQWPDHKADPIATLPQQVTLAQLQPAWRQEDPLRIPIALSHKELTPVLWDLGKSTVHQIIGHASKQPGISASGGYLLPPVPPGNASAQFA